MDNNLYKRRNSLRLEDYDYSSEGSYFITICVHDRLNVFGKIGADSQLIHHDAGNTMIDIWRKIPSKFESVDLDHFVIMPNHLHGILFLKEKPTTNPSTSEIIHWFKTVTTNAYINGVKNHQWKAFNAKLWQRSYHDHIIRNEESLNKLREYILTNPSRWAEDTYYSD